LKKGQGQDLNFENSSCCDIFITLCTLSPELRAAGDLGRFLWTDHKTHYGETAKEKNKTNKPIRDSLLAEPETLACFSNFAYIVIF
jgi:hypothetical protein